MQLRLAAGIFLSAFLGYPASMLDPSTNFLNPTALMASLGRVPHLAVLATNAA